MSSTNFGIIMCLHRTGSDPPAFECGSLQSIPLAQLCDGNNDCGDGEDEMLPMCDSEWIFNSSFYQPPAVLVQNYSIRM